MDRLHVVVQRSYNKRSTRYFVRFILTLIRIIYYLKCCTLIVLRYIEEEKDESDLKNGTVQVLEEVKNDQWKSKTDLCKEIFITF